MFYLQINPINVCLFLPHFCAPASASPGPAHLALPAGGECPVEYAGISEQEREVGNLTPLISTAVKGSYDWDTSSFGNHLASQKADVKYKIKARWQSHSKAPVRSREMGQRDPVIL